MFDVSVIAADAQRLALCASGPTTLDASTNLRPSPARAEATASDGGRRGSGFVGRLLAQAPKPCWRAARCAARSIASPARPRPARHDHHRKDPRVCTPDVGRDPRRGPRHPVDHCGPGARCRHAATATAMPPSTRCAMSRSPSRPSSSPRSWAPRAPASRRSCTCSPVSTVPTAAGRGRRPRHHRHQRSRAHQAAPRHDRLRLPGVQPAAGPDRAGEHRAPRQLAGRKADRDGSRR